ncbi:MAG TPA: NAD(P)-binding protein [Flexivirga sp.]|uniref:NAD(P)-binding protein n=1 Tax=Flexivirga sp. TaxID=1962927 RepID=UPI002C27F6B3|nr:NAD(P)-binding protein [Flexivirga sp.]HWC22760.1 NAD(P)-binding protein [Flexivirga sp.]
MSAHSAGRVLVVGELEATRLTCTLLRETGAEVRHLLAPQGREVVAALDEPADAVVIIMHSDVQALRYALLAAHTQPGVRIVTTIFDATVARQLVRVVPNCVATSPADIAVPSILGALLDDDALALRETGAGPRLVRQVEPTGGVTEEPWHPTHRRWHAGAERLIPRWYGGSPALMLTGLIGLALILLTDWILTTVVLHEPVVSSLYESARTIAAVGPADAHTGAGDSWYLVVSSIFMLITLVLTGTFVAGLVDWLMSARSVGVFGKLAIPRRNHVVIAGLGQVGLRACLSLQRLGVPVVAIERDPAAENLRLARNAGVPVLIGHAEDRATLARVRVEHALALAALGSDELDNIAIAITALAVAPQVRLVLRAGEDPVVAETTSLFRIGHVVDVSAQTAMAAQLHATGRHPVLAFGHGGVVHALVDDGDLESRRPVRCTCGAE